MEKSQHREVFYNVEWQILRVSLLASNNKKGGWVAHRVEAVNNNIKILRDYLGDNPSFNKIYRVYNLLMGVKRGYAQSHNLDSPGYKAANVFIKEMRELYFKNVYHGQIVTLQSREEVKKDLNNADDKDLLLVYKDLKSRLKAHDAYPNRMELRVFLLLLEKRLEKRLF